MKSLILNLLLLSVFLSACASTNGHQQLQESGAIALTTDGIIKAFSGVKEDYVAHDVPGVTAIAQFEKDGAFKAIWKDTQGNSGEVAGKWYAENNLRCIKFSKTTPDGNPLECVSFYRSGDVYTSVNPDGSIHGVHTLSPL